MSNSSQNTPLTSTPNTPNMNNMNYQQAFSPFPQIFPQPSMPPIPPFFAPPMSPGLESSIRELCQKMTNVETKLGKLDKIEERLESMDRKFKSVDLEVNDCKQRLNVLEQSAQFLSNSFEEQRDIKKRLETLTSNIESTKNVTDKLLDIEMKNLERNLLFFGLDEKPLLNEEGETKETGGGGGMDRKTKRESEDCMETLYNFLEQQMKFTDATNFKVEDAYRLGKRKPGANKPRPLVVKFHDGADKAKVKSASSRLKDTNFGISPHYPREIVERRKKLLPIMIDERKKKNNAYIVGDKLFVNGELWKG